jgi:NAD(P)-dependent dehydrogenase (short-subunit alcohol dehydrogenase family)
MSEQKVWFVTGANRGIGAETVKAALAAGHLVLATARQPATIEAAVGLSENLLALPLDITDEQQAHDSVKAAIARFGRIDVLVNNAATASSVRSKRPPSSSSRSSSRRTPSAP